MKRLRDAWLVLTGRAWIDDRPWQRLDIDTGSLTVRGRVLFSGGVHLADDTTTGA